MRKRSLTVKIKGEPWRVRLLKDDYFQQLHGFGCGAVTWKEARRIDFRESKLTLEYIIHEVSHAFISYLMLSSADVSPGDLEEIFCDMLSDNVSAIQQVSDEIAQGFAAVDERTKAEHEEAEAVKDPLKKVDANQRKV